MNSRRNFLLRTLPGLAAGSTAVALARTSEPAPATGPQQTEPPRMSRLPPLPESGFVANMAIAHGINEAIAVHCPNITTWPCEEYLALCANVRRMLGCSGLSKLRSSEGIRFLETLDRLSRDDLRVRGRSSPKAKGKI